MSARRAAAVCGVTRFAVRAWIDRGLLPEPPWTAQQLRRVSDAADLVASWPARLVVTAGVVGSRTPCRRPSMVDQSC
jgi:hypothetical protein